MISITRPLRKVHCVHESESEPGIRVNQITVCECQCVSACECVHLTEHGARYQLQTSVSLLSNTQEHANVDETEL